MAGVSKCLGATCQNGGFCVSGDVSFTCVCQPGFEGRLCETSACCRHLYSKSPLRVEGLLSNETKLNCLNKSTYSVLLLCDVVYGQMSTSVRRFRVSGAEFALMTSTLLCATVSRVSVARVVRTVSCNCFVSVGHKTRLASNAMLKKCGIL